MKQFNLGDKVRVNKFRNALPNFHSPFAGEVGIIRTIDFSKKFSYHVQFIKYDRLVCYTPEELEYAGFFTEGDFETI